MRTIFYCPECGSTNVYVRAWVDANTDAVWHDIDDDGTAYCYDCGREVKLADRYENDDDNV